jgi:hypothetical protein
MFHRNTEFKSNSSFFYSPTSPESLTVSVNTSNAVETFASVRLFYKRQLNCRSAARASHLYPSAISTKNNYKRLLNFKLFFVLLFSILAPVESIFLFFSR